MAMTTLLTAPGSRRVTVNPWSRASPLCEYHTESAPWSYVAATPACSLGGALERAGSSPLPKPAGTTRSASEDPAATSRAPEGPTWNERAPGPWAEVPAGWAAVASAGARGWGRGLAARRGTRRPTPRPAPVARGPANAWRRQSLDPWAQPRPPVRTSCPRSPPPLSPTASRSNRPARQFPRVRPRFPLGDRASPETLQPNVTRAPPPGGHLGKRRADPGSARVDPPRPLGR